ncbi:NAD(P)-dependent oxidoreductase [Nocardia goodfellowii]|uniref:3-hydroxyisobutyrate dehydrogenase-like beta-hydroxyacid dehydrogenase n=1 Tax=Nocardia goodfellowii TaxID=882446 RepID=A0ABS4QF18_9NOCA|nr:NAD(P)-binding domain-containing protein [Nocardia goodfellowii]MBP2190291.1 3-hydroxyisobutyrate dehydrogenase-like beta-hydroxyacid dehydrogenase [Nocardia goodfellowii]
MTGSSRTPVTVLGVGSMGRAVAMALLAAGHPTAVWNRSPERAAALVEHGAVHARTIQDAITAGPVIVSVLTGFDATLDTLAPVADALAGRTVLTLNSGSPAGARRMAEWIAARDARFLAGAIKNVPAAVGDSETLLYFGGDRAVFDHHAEILRALGGDIVHLGPEPDLAALYESAVGATLLPALLGFLEGAAVLATRGIPAAAMVPYSRKWLQMIESLLPILAAEIDTADYSRLGSSIALFHAAVAEDEALAAESGVDMSWHAAMHDLLRRAVAEGRGEQSITALFEVIRKPAA